MRRLALLCCAAVLVSACSRRSTEDAREQTPVVATVRSAAEGPLPLHEGDIRIVTADSGIDLALVGDTISTGLSPYALEKVRRETDTTTVQGTGMGASLEKLIKGKVAGAIGTRAGFPLSAIRDVRYESGALKFDWVGKPVNLFTNTKVNGRPVLESFSPADAQRFVDAVRARKSGRSRF